jgi:hypothetical protein
VASVSRVEEAGHMVRIISFLVLLRHITFFVLVIMIQLFPLVFHFSLGTPKVVQEKPDELALAICAILDTIDPFRQIQAKL